MRSLPLLRRALRTARWSAGSGRVAVKVLSRSDRGIRPLLAPVMASALALTLLGASTSAASMGSQEPEACPNASFRLGGLSAGLPDCRAYELVSPVEKNGGDIVGDGRTNVSSADGDGLALAARAGIVDTKGSGGVAISQYVATRGATSWSTHGVTPTPALSAVQIFVGDTFNLAFSADMSASVVTAYDLPGQTDDVPSGINLYHEDNVDNRLETITTPLGSESISPFGTLDFRMPGYSADLGVVTLQTARNLLPETVEGNGNPKLYAWSHGHLTLAGVLPDGSIPPGGSTAPIAEGLAVENLGSVSSDGSRVLFVSPADGSSPPQLYMRKDGSSTAWVSQSESSTPDPEPAEVSFQAASPNGREVVFSTSDRLLDSDPGGGGLALYRYTDSERPQTDSNLTFIARVAEGGRTHIVPAMSEDGARVYFLSEETAGLPAGDGGSQLYLWDQGAVRRVAGPFPDYGLRGEKEELWASADGRRIAVASEESLNGEDPTRVTSMYLYDETSDTLHCVSCPPSGAAPSRPIELEPNATHAAAIETLPLPPRHVLSNDERYVFFTSPEALVPQDTNGLPDVYEYNVETASLSLLSPGTGDNGSWFVEASPSGRDAFIVTREELSGWDVDTLADIYDARVEGGLPEPPPPPVPCAGDACQGIPSAVPDFATASGFSGLGNPVSKPAVKAKNKPKHTHRKKRHRPKRPSHARRGAKGRGTATRSSIHVGR